MKTIPIASALTALAIVTSCGDDADKAPTTGTLRIIGTWEGELQGEMRPSAAVFGCPFDMPPERTLGGDISGSTATIVGDELPAGKWCVLAFLDADRNDGVMPINGVDFVAYPPDGAQSFEVDIVAGQTTTLEVVYSFIPDDPVDTETQAGTSVDSDSETQGDSATEDQPGASDVWIHLTVNCEVCETTTPVVFYGYKGETMGTMPLIYNKYPNDVSFPFERTVKKTGPLTPAALPPGRYIVSAYQDENKTGMTPDEGEPVAEPTIIDLVAGQWNELTLQLE